MSNIPNNQQLVTHEVWKFFSKINENGPTIRPELGPCWIWTGARIGAGYGQVYFRGRGMLYAHRVSLQIHEGSIDESLHVLHKCDNPACVRPSHLFQGSDYENTVDKMSKGRQSRGWKHAIATGFIGENHPQAKLKAEQVLEIRRLHAAGGIFQRELAVKFGVTIYTIKAICERRLWAHLKDS